MAYATPENLVSAFPKVATAAFSVTDELGQFIARSDAFIDAYLARLYVVPFSAYPSTPPLIHQLSIDLTIPYIYDRSPNTPEWVNNLYERALETLKAIGEGMLLVVDSGGGVIPQRTDIGTPQSSTEGYVPTFGAIPATLDERSDPDRRQDEKDERGVL